MKKRQVREDVLSAYNSELVDVVEEQREAVAEESGKFTSARAAFRDPKMHRRLTGRLQEVTHLAVLGKKAHVPEMPWSCSGFLSVRCHGVHPWENCKEARQMLGLDALVPVHVKLEVK